MRDLYSLIFRLPPKQFTLVSVTLGFLLMEDLSVNEQNSLGNFFELIGQVMLTSAAQGQLLQGKQNANQNNQMQNDINRIKKVLNID